MFHFHDADTCFNFVLRHPIIGPWVNSVQHQLSKVDKRVLAKITDEEPKLEAQIAYIIGTYNHTDLLSWYVEVGNEFWNEIGPIYSKYNSLLEWMVSWLGQELNLDIDDYIAAIEWCVDHGMCFSLSQNIFVESADGSPVSGGILDRLNTVWLADEEEMPVFEWFSNPDEAPHWFSCLLVSQEAYSDFLSCISPQELEYKKQ